MSNEHIYFHQVNGPLQLELMASEDGEVLAFKNAILARAEVNLNLDEIDQEGIRQLARTITGRPVDVEHNISENCGVFTSASPIEDGMALSVDGFIWADRYPNEAKGIQVGTHGLSVEAMAEEAICSVCNQTFYSAESYCVHLTSRSAFGATRRLRKLRGKGGAVTTRPAGTNTEFKPEQIYFVASHNELESSWYDKYLKEKGETLKDLPDSDFADPAGRRFPYKIHGDVKEEGWRAAWSAANGGHTGKKDEGAIAKLRRDKPKGIEIKESQEEPMQEDKKPEEVVAPVVEASVPPAAEPPAVEACNTPPVKAEAAQEPPVPPEDEDKEDVEAKAAYAKFSEELAAMQAQFSSLKSSLDALSGVVSKLEAARESDRMSARRQLLVAHLTDEEWESQKETIGGMDDKAFNLFVGSMKKAPLTFISSVRLPEPVAGGTKEPLTLGQR